MANSAPPPLIEYPCQFPIKVMGEDVPGYVDAIVAIARTFDPGYDSATLKRRASRTGRYLGLTLSVRVHSRAQLDELYRTLSTHPLVKVVL